MVDDQLDFELEMESVDSTGDMSPDPQGGKNRNDSPSHASGLSIMTYLTGNKDPDGRYDTSFTKLTPWQKEVFLEYQNKEIKESKEKEELDKMIYCLSKGLPYRSPQKEKRPRAIREKEFEEKFGYPLSWKEYEIRRDFYKERGEITYSLEMNPHSMIIKKHEFLPGKNKGGGERSGITDYSYKSRKRMYAKIHTINWDMYPKENTSFVTLTYPEFYPMDGKEIKKQLNILSKRIRRHGSRYRFLSFFWKLEFQDRGAPHFHFIMVTGKTIDYQLFREWLSNAWAEIIYKWMKTQNIDSEKAFEAYQKSIKAGTSVEPIKEEKANALGYLSMYIQGEHSKKSKEYQHFVPDQYKNVGRWWGIYGDELKQKNTKVHVLTEEEYYKTDLWIKKRWKDKNLPDYKTRGGIVTYYFLNNDF